MTASRLDTAATVLVAVAFGVVLSRIGFSEWDEVHAMFTLRDARLVGVFATAVVILSLGWKGVARFTGQRWPPRAIHRGTILGGIMFGAGWALSGACPSVALVALGEGQLGALVTLVGVFLGNWAYGVAQAGWLHWSNESCSPD